MSEASGEGSQRIKFASSTTARTIVAPKRQRALAELVPARSKPVPLTSTTVPPRPGPDAREATGPAAVVYVRETTGEARAMKLAAGRLSSV